MRSIEEINREIRELEEELEQAEFGSYEYDEFDRELSLLEAELRDSESRRTAMQINGVSQLQRELLNEIRACNTEQDLEEFIDSVEPEYRQEVLLLAWRAVLLLT